MARCFCSFLTLHGSPLKRFSDMMQYSSEISIPIKFLFSFLAAIAVVPLPIKGSRITFAYVLLLILSIRGGGKGEGWGLFISCANSHISPWEFAFGANLNFDFAIR